MVSDRHAASERPCADRFLDTTWSVVRLNRIEDLRDAVFGAGLEAVQMTQEPVTGGLAFARQDDIVFTCGRLDGTVSLSGPLSEDCITLGLGLRIAPGSWHWLEPVADGSVGVFRPADEHDSLYRAGSLYAAVTLRQERLEQEAAGLDLVLDDRTLGATRFRAEKVGPRRLTELRDRFDRIHRGDPGDNGQCADLLRLLISQCARRPRVPAGQKPTKSHRRIVSLARAYIDANLHEPIRIEDIVAAANTSKRTLYRAFMEFMGEPPQVYVRRLRLHRIREDLASEAEAGCTIALIANQWGIAEPGRLSGWYRELFGELPSETVARRQRSADTPAAAGADGLARTAQKVGTMRID
ncbi:MAG: ethanolamine operon regulator [Rhodobacteraceae bacterium]|nr:ethanolamine operon regulator [Paracoccaceae bacterium]